jgi:hypothetical protein
MMPTEQLLPVYSSTNYATANWLLTNCARCRRHMAAIPEASLVGRNKQPAAAEHKDYL